MMRVVSGHLTTALFLIAALSAASPAGPQIPRPFPVPGGSRTTAPPRRALPASTTSIRVGVARTGGYEIVSVPLETYVARVLGGEAAPNTAPGALEALAIAVRTYAMVNLGRHQTDGGFDVCDQVHCQVVRTANPGTEDAAAATAGQVLLKPDRTPARVFYSASCGGRTEIPSAVWPGEEDAPYLPSQPDEACAGEPVWSTDMTVAELERALAGAGFRGSLRAVRIASYQGSGRVAILELAGMTPSTISAQDLRMAVSRVFGPRYLMSAAFELRRAGDTFTFSGHGYGHGVGMCVFGAMNLARQGATAQTILLRYFPGLSIGPFQPGTPPRPTLTRATPPVPVPPPSSQAEVRPAPVPPVPVTSAAAAVGATNVAGADVPRIGIGVNVVMPPGEQDARDTMAARFAQARDDVVGWLKVASPATLELRVHASAADFMEATGEQWFIPGAVVRGVVHLPPLDTLRNRGILDRTLRRVLVLRLAGDALATRDVWVREGLAVYASDPGAAARPREAPRRTSCPDDRELERPLSAGAYSEAAARARACVARQLASGRDWRDLR